MLLTGSWKEWHPAEQIEILRPEKQEEGGNVPLHASRFEAASEPLNVILERVKRTYVEQNCLTGCYQFSDRIFGMARLTIERRG